MRIDRLVIQHYGPIEPRTLDFTAGAEGLHVVYGGNEWGKSLSLQALEHGLFSIPKKIDGFSDQDMARLELVLAISRRTGDALPQRCAFRRLRQRLTEVSGNEPIDERSVLAYLGGVTEVDPDFRAP